MIQSFAFSGLTAPSTNQGDRFIPNRSNMNVDVSHFNLLQPNTNPIENQHTHQSHYPSHSFYQTSTYKTTLSSQLFGERQALEECKILTLQNKAPKSIPNELSSTTQQYSIAHDAKKPVTRQISPAPEKILDAPGLVDDYYLNILDWSTTNILAVALGPTIYLWNAYTSDIKELVSYPNDKIVTSLSWSPSLPEHIALGTSDNLVELWDVEKTTKLRTLTSHEGRVISLAWNKHVLSSGSFDTLIHNHDHRLATPLISSFSHHTGEVCGLKWSHDGTQLASGGNDNLLNIWQFDTSTVSAPPRFSIEDHKAAVKALAWCPFQSHVLASGGGSADRTIKFWNTMTGTCLNSVDTESQVCAIQWSKSRKELVSSHGFSQNQLCVWKYPTMTKMAELKGHTQRVMHMALSPDGTTVCSGSADESLRFWRVFEGMSGRDGMMRGGSRRNSRQYDSLMIDYYQR